MVAYLRINFNLLELYNVAEKTIYFLLNLLYNTLISDREFHFSDKNLRKRKKKNQLSPYRTSPI